MFYFCLFFLSKNRKITYYKIEKSIWHKDEIHRLKRLQQMRDYHHKKKKALLKEFKFTISHEKYTIDFK